MDYGVLKSEIDELRQEVPQNTYLLYAMGLRLGTMDYDALSVNSLLDGPDDKKIDFFHVDHETGIATVAQGYESIDWTRIQAPSSKAADLNTATSWLLESDLSEIPRVAVRACAEELRDGLATGEITRVEIFYIHNLPHSAQVQSELATVQRATQRLLERYGNAAGQTPECVVREISRDIVEEWYRSQHDTASVHDDIELMSQMDVQILETPEWNAAIAAIPARELVDLNTKYGDALYSANVRDYLGSRESSRNINRQIERTAETEPQNFMIYNNGATVLTNRIQIFDRLIKLSGVSVINGAQTLGSLAQAAARGNLGDANLLVRFVKCNDKTLVESVIRYNNTQNPIKAWELRVIDPIQRRLQRGVSKAGCYLSAATGCQQEKSIGRSLRKTWTILECILRRPRGSAQE